MLTFVVVDVAGRISPLVGVRPTQSHIADAEPVKIAQKMNVVLDRVTAFNSHERGKFLVFVGTRDISDRERHYHAIRMPGGLLVDRIDEIERVLGEVALIGCGFDPDGKELGAQVAGAGFIEPDVTAVVGVGGTDVIIFVEEPLRCVSVCVYDDGRIVNGFGAGANGGSLSYGNRA